MTYEDLTEDLAQIARLRSRRRNRDALLVLDALREAFPGHPDLARGFRKRAAPVAIDQRHTQSILIRGPLGGRSRRRAA